MPEAMCTICIRNGNNNEYQFLSQCVLRSESLMSEEVIIYREKAWGPLLLFKQSVVVMKTMYYACVPSFISLCSTVSKFEE